MVLYDDDDNDGDNDDGNDDDRTAEYTRRTGGLTI